MKSFLFTVSLGLAAFACIGSAEASQVVIDTAQGHHEYTDCPAFDAVDVARVGTVVTVIANCAHHERTPQVAGWQPLTHPDNAPLWWNGRIRADAGRAWSQCEVSDYQRYAGEELLVAQCRDADPSNTKPRR